MPDGSAASRGAGSISTDLGVRGIKRPTPKPRMPAAAEPQKLRRDLPDHTTARRIARSCAAGRCRTVEIAVRVEYHVAVRISPGAAASKVVQRGVRPTVA